MNEKEKDKEVKMNEKRKMWYDKLGTERERIIGGICLTVFFISILFVFFYPSVPIEVEFHGKGNFTLPRGMVPNNMTLSISEIKGRYSTAVPASVYIKTITVLGEIYRP